MEAAWSSMNFAPSSQQASVYAPNLRLDLSASGAEGSSSDVASYASHTRSHSMDSLHAHIKRTRQNWYPSEEARLEAKRAQKARRREQNRNAQRRLRDRKEEHIFNLEGEVSRLRKQHEKQQAVESDLEDMLRRLVSERDELQRRLSLADPTAPSSITFASRARSSSSHAFLPSLKSEPVDGVASRPAFSEYQRSFVVDEVICESPDGDADLDQDGSSYPLSALPFAQAAEGRIRSLSLHLPKPMMAGHISMDAWSPSAVSHSIHLDRHARASDSPRDSEPLSAQSSASGSTNSSVSIATTPPSSATSHNPTALANVMLTHPARWDDN